MRKNKNSLNKGITLIALVITIIVLLILAGVSIATLTGSNGILIQATKAKEETEKSQWEERIDIVIAGKEAEKAGKESPTIDDIIAGLIDEDVIDNESQVDKETGDITTNEPSYVISDKLDKYLSGVKITVSKTPETEMSGGVILKVEKVDGIEGNIDLNTVDISKLSEAEKKEMTKTIDVFGWNNFGNGNYTCFQDLLEDKYNGNEQEYWKEIEEGSGSVENTLKEMINSLQEEGIQNVNNYVVVNHDNEVSDSYVVLKNGTYTFTVNEISTGKSYTKSVEVTNIDESMEYYYVYGEPGGVDLRDRNGERINFEEAYMIYKGEKIDVSSSIENYENEMYIDILDLVRYMENRGIVESRHDLSGTIQNFEIVKDGKSYFGDAKIMWYE